MAFGKRGGCQIGQVAVPPWRRSPTSFGKIWNTLLPRNAAPACLCTDASCSIDPWGYSGKRKMGLEAAHAGGHSKRRMPLMQVHLRTRPDSGATPVGTGTHVWVGEADWYGVRLRIVTPRRAGSGVRVCPKGLVSPGI